MWLPIAAAVVGIPLLLVLLSMDAVEQNEYGLVFNWVTKTLDEDVYHGGTHFIGFWNRFIVFPATVQTIEFSDRPGLATAPMLHTRTKEGLGLFLTISFQYQLDPKRLKELFALTNTRYEALFARIARDQLLEAASEYEGPQYWLERQVIGEHMRRLVDTQLKQSCASLWGLQLQVIDLPDKYEQSITLTQVQKQIIKTKMNEQVAAGIRASTEVLRAQFARQVQVVQAEAQANYTKQTKLAEAEATRRKITAEADAVGYVRDKLHLTPEETVRFAEVSAYATMPNATFLANVPGLLAQVQLPSAGAPAAPARAAASSALLDQRAGGTNATSRRGFLRPRLREDPGRQRRIAKFFQEQLSTSGLFPGADPAALG